MSLAGLKKQFNKANQFISETVGTAEPTKLDDEYLEMEKKVDVTYELVNDLIARTREHLQPNPVTRAKLYTGGALFKVRGGAGGVGSAAGASVKAQPYPQTEGLLGESMVKYAKLLNADNVFGKALHDSGEAFKQMADVKYAMEDNVKQNFLDPLDHLLNKDLKEVFHHRKKMQGRRLDFDCKKHGKMPQDEILAAEEKLEDSKQLAEMAMFNVLENDTEQISQLAALVETQLDFHRQTADILENLQSTLLQRIQEASGRPRREHSPKTVIRQGSSGSRSPNPDGVGSGGLVNNNASPALAHKPPGGPQDPWGSALPPPAAATNNTYATPSVQDPWVTVAPAQPPYAQAAPPRRPCCRAIYDFEPENEGELGFKEGETINLTSKIDENWFEGTVADGRAGFFPISYVQVVVPLSQLLCFRYAENVGSAISIETGT